MKKEIVMCKVNSRDLTSEKKVYQKKQKMGR